MSKPCQFEGCEKSQWRKALCLGHYSQMKRFGECSEIHNFLGIEGALAERINSKLKQVGECWEWTGALNSSGYGAIKLNGATVCAHRVVYEALVGAVPAGHELDHQCWNPACVNVAHLKPVTHKENVENPRPGGWGKTGLRGVQQTSKNRFGAFVSHDGKQRCYGTFLTKEEAAETARTVRNRVFTNNRADRIAA